MVIILLIFHNLCSAEGTKQLEPIGAPSKSHCKIILTQNNYENRIPFALLDCNEDYRLNIHISDYTNEKIYFGFGDIIDYFDATTIFTDVNYQLRNPAGNIVVGYSLQPLPNLTGSAGYINTRDEAELGPNFNNSNPGGYKPLLITPGMNGDYILEFKIPNISSSEMRVFKYFDVTVAKSGNPVTGRLWSKAWQFSSGSTIADESASYSLFYIYTNDSIVTRFDCNGLAGGVWDIYSNEWGCSTNGTWSDRRRSIVGNASVQPQYKIFLNNPDPVAFPSGIIGEMNSFEVLPYECDTVISFAATVSKGGNIEVLLDVPPLNPNAFGPEDVQLGYNVSSGYNLLLPAWNGKNAFGIPLLNGTQVEARIRFLNGLSNIPLFDVEDNPNGFKVNIERPLPVSASTRLKLYWDDTSLPDFNSPTSNVLEGCEYTGIDPISGCHEWMTSYNLGDMNTINSWWYFTSGGALIIPIVLKLSPPVGDIIGPDNICAGQMVTFRTAAIPFAQKYIWHLSGPGVSVDIEKNAPDTTFFQVFSASMPQGNYTVSVFGRNLQCGDGAAVYHTSFVYDDQPPPVAGTATVCVNTSNQYQIPGSYSSIHWTSNQGKIIGSADVNPVTIMWSSTGSDTIQAMATSTDCGTRLSAMIVAVHPVASAGFAVSDEATTCPGLPMNFNDTTQLASGSVVLRNWDWGDGLSSSGNDSVIIHPFTTTGAYTVKLTVTTDQGCESVAANQIRIIPFPEASFSNYRNCVAHAIELTDNSTSIKLVSRIWDFGSAPVTTSNLTLEQPSAVFHSPGQFPVRLVVTNQYGCTDTVIQQVTIHKLPEAIFTYETPCQDAGIVFTDQSKAADTALIQSSWNTISGAGIERFFYGNPTVLSFDEAANYRVNLVTMDAFGCTDTASSLIAIKPKPDCSFDFTENVDNITGLLQFRNHTKGATRYLWDFGNSFTSELIEPEIKYNLEGTYTIELVATSMDGCTDTAMKQYYYMPGLWLPNAFSPDSDGLNDIFRPVTQRNTLEPYLLLVYNRWGQLIFKSDKPEVGWDGTFQGRPCQVGEYSYKVQYREEKIKSSQTIIQRGFVCLIR